MSLFYNFLHHLNLSTNLNQLKVLKSQTRICMNILRLKFKLTFNLKHSIQPNNIQLESGTSCLNLHSYFHRTFLSIVIFFLCILKTCLERTIVLIKSCY